MDDALEPWSPRALYVVGHHATFVGGFFQQVTLLAQLAGHPDDKVAAWRRHAVRALQLEREHVSALVVFAHTVAAAHGLTLPEPPATPDAWDPWRGAVFRGLRERLDLSTPEAAPFAFGWEHGLARATLVGLATLADLGRAGLDRPAPLAAGLQDLRAGAARWAGSAQLVGALPGSRELLLTWNLVEREIGTLTKAHPAPGDGAARDAIGQAAARLSRALRELEGVAWRVLSPERGSAGGRRTR